MNKPNFLLKLIDSIELLNLPHCMYLCQHYFLDVQALYQDFRLEQHAEMMYSHPTANQMTIDIYY